MACNKPGNEATLKSHVTQNTQIGGLDIHRWNTILSLTVLFPGGERGLIKYVLSMWNT